MQKTILEILSAPAQKKLEITKSQNGLFGLFALNSRQDKTTRQRQDYNKSVTLFWVGFNHLRPMWDLAPHT